MACGFCVHFSKTFPGLAQFCSACAPPDGQSGTRATVYFSVQFSSSYRLPRAGSLCVRLGVGPGLLGYLWVRCPKLLPLHGPPGPSWFPEAPFLVFTQKSEALFTPLLTCASCKYCNCIWGRLVGGQRKKVADNSFTHSLETIPPPLESWVSQGRAATL